MDRIIKRFSISGLYGERDVDINFQNNIKIIVAENGYGKTTVLNALYALLSGDVLRLRKIEFNSIQIEFSDNSKFTLKSSDIKLTAEIFKDNPLFDHLTRRVGEPATLELFESFTVYPKKFKDSKLIKSISKSADVSTYHLASMIETLHSEDQFKVKRKAHEILSSIKSKFPYNIVYLPTYRRVEQDFKDLGLDEEVNSFHDHSVNFGMRDVDERFKEITSEISKSSVDWFSKVNGQMLSQLVHGFHVDDTTKESIDNLEAIKIVLDRIGTNIEESSKQEIMRLVESKEIFSNHDPLVYFISNLVKVYEQQQSNDKAIQDFSEVCNRYLVDKRINYNESKVSIDIVRRKNGRQVDIQKLSSGEKQIISLFARLYLKRENRLAIFFDEPELSLSIEWQRTLLPDIINSGKCAFLFTTTHSPFIFENDLVNNAVGLGEYIKEL